MRGCRPYLRRHGRVQGSYDDQAAHCLTPAACLVAAIGVVRYGGPVDAPALNDTDPGFGDSEAARDYLDSYLSRTVPYDVDGYGYNDHTGRTPKTFVVLLTGAAARYELAALMDAGLASPCPPWWPCSPTTAVASQPRRCVQAAVTASTQTKPSCLPMARRGRHGMSIGMP